MRTVSLYISESSALQSYNIEEAKIHCAGVNSCTGQSSCKGAKNSRKRQNPCKKQCFKELTQKECDAAEARQK
jgi:hypothetical protein